MNALVHISNVPAQTTCSFCPRPGSCCRDFVLTKSGPDGPENFSFWKDSWREDAAREMEFHNLPFVASRIQDEFVADTGATYVTVRFDCPELGGDGRCMTYETRPRICRDYVPLENSLCCLTKGGRA